MSAVRDSGGRFTSAPRVGALYRVSKEGSDSNGALVRVLAGATRNGYVPVMVIGTADTPRSEWKRKQYRPDHLTPQ